jgi:hypothetical protein
MSNALTVISGNGAALTPMQAAVLAEMEADNGGAYDYKPTRIKFPSGGMMAFSVDDTDTLKPPVKAIIAVSQKARAFWPSKDTAGQPPLCSSPDGVVGMFDPKSEQVPAALAFPPKYRHLALAEIDEENAKGPWDCLNCPLSLWESAGDGRRGKACKDLRRLVVLVEGWSMPAIMTLPPTSIKAFDTFASARARTRGEAYFTAWTRIELAQETNGAGIKFSVAKFSVEKPLSEAELAAVIDVRHQFAELVRSMNIGADDYATEDPEDAAARSFVEAPVSNEEMPF